ncbi:response regulator [Phaeospirillum tilakii]|uniref:histidine kinase n=1 Tax=Phaeospirillum tilakii TaxID=741673 RepID=A0ABW5CEN6_9PROT
MSRLSAWRNNIGMAHRLVIAVVLASLFVIAGASTSAWRSHQQYRHQVEVDTRNLSKIVEKSVSDTFTLNELVLIALADNIVDGPAEPEAIIARTERLVRAIKARYPKIDGLSFIDRDGRILFRNDAPPDRDYSIADRDYFILARDGDGETVFGGPHLGRVSGKASLYMARRVTDADNHFLGVVSATILLDDIQAFLATVDVGPQGGISLRDAGMAILVRHPDPGGRFRGNRTVSKELIELMASGAAEGGYHSGTTWDGTARAVYFSRVGAYPFYVNVGIGDADYLDTWRRQTVISGLLAVTFVLLSTLWAVSYYRNWRMGQAADAAALSSVEQRFRLAMSATNDGVWDWDVRAGTTYYSPSYFRMIGLRPDALAGDARRQAELIHPDDLDQVLAANARCIDHGIDEYALELRMRTADGGWKWILRRGQVVERDAARRATRIIGTHVDITPLKEAMLRAADALRVKDEFLAHMSHEIRTPMNGVLGMLNVVLLNDLPAAVRSQVESAVRSAGRLLGILNGILDLSKMEAGRAEIAAIRFDLDEVLAQAAETFRYRREESGLTLRIERPPEVPRHLIGDPLRIGQIVGNFLSNAIKFTTRGGIVVEVSVPPEPAPEPGREILLRIAVTDSGRGLGREQQQRLFQPFEQAGLPAGHQFGGTGLGLAICRRLAALMGGETGVDSALGAGSTFWFTARVTVADPAAASPAATDPGIDLLLLDGTRVLLVEDDPTNQMVALGLLRAVGARVDVADDGASGVEMARRGDYEIVLMDVQMPGLDGLAATRLIKADPRLADLPVIAMTANALDRQRQDCLEAGMDDFVAKPFEPGELFTLIQKWVTGLGPAEAQGLQAMVADDQGDCPPLGAIPGLDVRAGLRHLSGMRRLYRDVLGKFARQHRHTAATVRQELLAGRIDQVAAAAHTLKGLAATLGATAVRAAALEMEDHARRGDGAGCATALDRLEAEITALIAAIEAVGVIGGDAPAASDAAAG